MSFIVKNHKLYIKGEGDVDRIVAQSPSPNYGKQITPSVLVLHYTATRSAASAIRTLADAKAASRVSCHLVLDRDGVVTQLLPFNVAGWHVGVSEYKGRQGVNNFSIGIEMVNAGIVARPRAGFYVDWTGSQVPSDEVIQAKHRITGGMGYWQTYPQAQIDAAVAIGRALFDAYKLKDVVGHEDVATPKGRKTDPGPAFPLSATKLQIMANA